MSPKRRKFLRPRGNRRYRRLYVVAVEGDKTEPQYFGLLNDSQSIVQINCLKGRHNSSPHGVLKRMKEHLKREALQGSDEAWLVVDKDNWNDEQLRALFEWSQSHSNFGLALSNPCFEYWLLLHFDEGDGISAKAECLHRLKRHIPNYSKGIDCSLFTEVRIRMAIAHAKRRDSPPCSDWPRIPGGSTVYRLVERIMNHRGPASP